MGRELLANTVSMTIDPEGKTISNIPWESDMNVQDAMQEAYSISPGIDFALQYFGPTLGYSVLMIDGTFDSSTEFWFLYINGELSPTGIDSTILNDGDVIGFVFEKYSGDTHGKVEIHKAKHHFKTLGKGKPTRK